jgi:hypothetical protein
MTLLILTAIAFSPRFPPDRATPIDLCKRAAPFETSKLERLLTPLPSTSPPFTPRSLPASPLSATTLKSVPHCAPRLRFKHRSSGAIPCNPIANSLHCVVRFSAARLTRSLRIYRLHQPRPHVILACSSIVFLFIRAQDSYVTIRAAMARLLLCSTSSIQRGCSSRARGECSAVYPCCMLL